MITEVLKFLTEKLNAHLKEKYSLNEDIVILSDLVNSEGSLLPQTINRVVITVINFQQQAGTSHIGINRSNSVESLTFFPYILISSNNQNYENSLNYISEVSQFFHDKKKFISEDNLPGNVAEIIPEIVNADFSDLTSIWSCLSTPYRPSLIYKVLIR